MLQAQRLVGHVSSHFNRSHVLTCFGQLPISALWEAGYSSTSGALFDCGADYDGEYDHVAVVVWSG